MTTGRGTRDPVSARCAISWAMVGTNRKHGQACQLNICRSRNPARKCARHALSEPGSALGWASRRGSHRRFDAITLKEDEADRERLLASLTLLTGLLILIGHGDGPTRPDHAAARDDGHVKAFLAFPSVTTFVNPFRKDQCHAEQALRHRARFRVHRRHRRKQRQLRARHFGRWPLCRLFKLCHEPRAG